MIRQPPEQMADDKCRSALEGSQASPRSEKSIECG
jgi:hypothetical protein